MLNFGHWILFWPVSCPPIWFRHYKLSLTHLVKTVFFPFQTKADPDFESASSPPSPNLTALSEPPRVASPEASKANENSATTKESAVIKKEKVALPPRGRRKYTKRMGEYVETENVSVPIQEVQL